MFEPVVRGVRRPTRVLAEARRAVGRVQNRLRGCDVMAEDWDNLLVLDGCRYDAFARANTLEGRLESRRSPGSATREFVRNAFVGRRFDDTVYVTANPFVSMDAGDAFAAMADVWRTDWDADLGTVRPEAMEAAVRRTHEAYPNKRLIGHLMQPHHPFIGPTGRALLSDAAGNEVARQRAIDGTRPEGSGPDPVWALVADGRLALEDVRAAYAENLEIVLPTVRTLVEELPGRTVVTSDHGNLLDEPAYGVLGAGSRRFAHPKHATAAALVEVPWLVCPARERRRVTEGVPARREPASTGAGAVGAGPGGRRDGTAAASGGLHRVDDGADGNRVVEDRLEALGYR